MVLWNHPKYTSALEPKQESLVRRSWICMCGLGLISHLITAEFLDKPTGSTHLAEVPNARFVQWRIPNLPTRDCWFCLVLLWSSHRHFVTQSIVKPNKATKSRMNWRWFDLCWWNLKTESSGGLIVGIPVNGLKLETYFTLTLGLAFLYLLVHGEIHRSLPRVNANKWEIKAKCISNQY